MKSFKFFKSNKVPVKYPPLYSLTIKNHPRAMFADREMINIFHWASDDVLRYEYELVMFRGAIMNFAHAYEVRKTYLRADEYLPTIPVIESILYQDGCEYRKWSHEFQDPNEPVEIFYKLYTR